MGTSLVSDSRGQTPAKSYDRKAQTTRFYGVGFLRGKMKDQDIQAYLDNKESGTSILCDTYGMSLCMLLALSIIAVTLGMSLALAGHFTPKKRLESLVGGNQTGHENIQTVLRYNHMLESFVLSGMVLLAIGIILFVVLMVAPFCSNYDVSIKTKEGYNLAPYSDVEEKVVTEKKMEGNHRSVAMEKTDSSPAGIFATMHQQLKPTDDQGDYDLP